MKKYSRYHYNHRTRNKPLNNVGLDDVIDALKGLKEGKAIGQDGIPSFIFKGFVDIFCYPLLSLFNLSLKTKIFSDHWKQAKICPVFKKKRQVRYT